MGVGIDLPICLGSKVLANRASVEVSYFHKYISPGSTFLGLVKRLMVNFLTQI